AASVVFKRQAHTSLDSMRIAFWLADEFHLINRKILEPTGIIDTVQYGIGVCGELQPPLPTEDFFAKLCREIPHTRPFFNIGKPPRMIKKIAICGGSGSALFEEAQNFGADCLITGDTKYHTALNVSRQNTDFAIIEVGHHSLEEEMMRRFTLLLQEKLPKVRISFISSKDPFIQIME
ncbi:MAG: Nif3-like dinuclear metal center hexameric protein, partial [Mailhella sp.]|nr:Nif3-like dinuclear metal center hexameric protein [Mailhella sp.]